MLRKLLIGFLFLIPSTAVFPQLASDTTFLDEAIQNATQRYHRAIGSQAKIYNGSRYPESNASVEEHPFFLSDDWFIGDAFYDGELFSNVPLMYDIVTSNLVTEHLSSGHPIQLITAKLKRFSLAGHNFEKIENESVGGSLPKTDFYDIVYSGQSKVIALHQKIVRERIESGDVVTYFPEKTRHFLFKNGIFFHVKSKTSALKVLKEEKQPLKKFLKSNKIIFSLDREASLIGMAQFYDSLKNEPNP
jgi:hypothetical protein